MKRFLWFVAGIVGTFVAVVVWRYQPKAVTVGTKVAVGSEATPSPAVAAAPTPSTGPSATSTPKPATTTTPKPTATPKPGGTPKPTAAPTPTPVPTPTPTPRGQYAHDGSFTGKEVDTSPYYGPVQVQAVISNGYITNVVFLQMPQGGNSSFITSQAEPALLSETLHAQSASINTVSGATQDTQAYKASLSDALSKT